MIKAIEDYQQGANLINKEEEYQIIEYIEKNQILCPACLYRGVCLGKTYEVGDIIEISEKGFASWTEDEAVAAEFSKERGIEISAVFQVENEFGIPLEDYSNEMEWLVLSKEYEVIEAKEDSGYEGEGYMLYTLKLKENSH